MPKRTIIPLYAIVLGFAVCIPVKPSNSEINSLNKLPGHVADNFAIEELLASGDSDLALADPERVTLLWSTTFEKGMGLAPPGSLARHYSSDFRRKSTRMICWEIIVRHAPASYDRDLNLQFRLQNGSDRPVATGRSDSWIPANSSSSSHSACWGWSYANFWESGQYRFRIVPDGRTHLGENGLLAVIGFTVD